MYSLSLMKSDLGFRFGVWGLGCDLVGRGERKNRGGERQGEERGKGGRKREGVRGSSKGTRKEGGERCTALSRSASLA